MRDIARGRFCAVLAVLLLLGCASNDAYKPKFSAREIKKLAAEMSPAHRQFLDDVLPIITDEEKDEFLSLTQEHDREKFIAEFWRARSKDAAGFYMDFKREYYERLDVVRGEAAGAYGLRPYLMAIRMPGAAEKGRDPVAVFLLNGAPDEDSSLGCEGVIWPAQIWRYKRLQSTGDTNVTFIFVKADGFGYRLWLPEDGIRAFLVNQLGDYSGGASVGPEDLRVLAGCVEGRELLMATTRVNFDGSRQKAEAAARSGRNEKKQLVGQVADLDSGVGVLKAEPAGIDFSVSSGNDNKVTVEIYFLIPRDNLRVRELAGARFYNVGAIFQLVTRGREIAKKEFRFDFAGEGASASLPVAVYQAIVKLTDENGRAETRWEKDISVPEVAEARKPRESAPPKASEVPEERIAGNVPDIGSGVPVAAAPRAASAAGKDAPVRPVAMILGGKPLFLGVERFEVIADEAVASVSFVLDGRERIVKNNPPFSAEFDLGPIPRRHELSVVGHDSRGKEVGRDQALLNNGAHSAALKIVYPAGDKVGGPTRVQAAVTLPAECSVRRMDFFVNDVLSGTRLAEPWIKTVHVPEGGAFATLRVVATLSDDTVIEDLKYVNSPGFASSAEVSAVELYAVVHDKHRQPVKALHAANFRVLENGVPQKIENLEYAANSPATVGIIVDSSSSMRERGFMEVLKSAIGFVDNVLGPGDRGFSMAFSDSPDLLSPVTSNKGKLRLSFAGLRAQGLTAFYDALVAGLYELQDMKGRRALVVLTDGKDEGVQLEGKSFNRQSIYDLDTVRRYAGRAGIPIYFVGLKLADPEFRKILDEISILSGGATYYVDAADGLSGAYRDISEELHSQYVITYYPTSKGKDWRNIRVTTDLGYKVRVASGYYPQ
jgi:VWFA-related protein